MLQGQAPPRPKLLKDVGSEPLPPAFVMPPPAGPPRPQDVTLDLLNDNVTLADVLGSKTQHYLRHRNTNYTTSSTNVNTIIVSSGGYPPSSSSSSASSFGNGSQNQDLNPRVDLPHLGNHHVSLDTSTVGSTSEDYAKLKEEFYQSYNPQIGLHTAAVLGGILGWLIVYLLYKTKVKKWVVGFAKRKYKKRKQRRLEKKKAARELSGDYPDNDFLSPPPTSSSHPPLHRCAHVNNNHMQQQLQYQPQQQCQRHLWPAEQLESHPPAAGCGGLPSCSGFPHSSHCVPLEESIGEEEGTPFLLDRASCPQHCAMPSIVVESYSSLPHGNRLPTPENVVESSACQPLQTIATGKGVMGTYDQKENVNTNVQQSASSKLRKKTGRGGGGEKKQKTQRQQQHPQNPPQPHHQHNHSPQHLHQQHCQGSEDCQDQQDPSRGRGGPERKKRYRRRKSHSHRRRCPEVTVLDVDEPDTKSLLLPTCSETDTAQATARWVQTMPLLMRSQQDFTGLILKIQPDVLGKQRQQSCPLISAALQSAALPLLGPPNVGWKNSMPHLSDKGAGLKDVLTGDNACLLDRSEAFSGHGLLRPLQSSAPPSSRPQSSLCQMAPSLLHPPPQHPRSPPCLRVPTPAPQGQTGFSTSASATNLTVPTAACHAGGAGGLAPINTNAPGGMPLSSFSAPTSPVPIPVTPTVTIQNCTTSRGLSRLDSDGSATSSSSLDPLLQLQHDCNCQQRTSPHQYPHHQQQPQRQTPLGSRSQPQSHAKASPLSSWTVFNDGDDGSCGGATGGTGSNGGGGVGGSGGGGGGCSRQNSFHSDCSASSYPGRPVGRGGVGDPKGRSGPHDAVLTLETKL